MYTIKDPTIVDIECFKNFFLISFRNIRTKQVVNVSRDNLSAARQILCDYTTVGFNSIKYDLPMICGAMSGLDEAQLKILSDTLIQSGEPWWKICREREIYIPDEWDHVDLIDVAPGVMTSLKIYGGRMHSERLQDLPYPHDAVLTDEQKQVVTDYCANDLVTTEDMFHRLIPQLDLRVSMSETYGVDLRSKSDAQVAEAVLRTEALRMAGTTVRKIPQTAGTVLRYTDPGFLTFKSPACVALFERILSTEFTLGENGAPVMPEWMKLFAIPIGTSRYKLGIGGLHSQETCQTLRAGGGYMLADFDVASFYPNIILQQGMYPPGVGPTFLEIYKSIVDRRIAAKRSGDSVVADSLKITLNGTYGKLGSPYSFLYSPQQLIQVTLTGQLALLMLIEQLHDAGIECKSANTDGIVLFYHQSKEFSLFEILEWWMNTTRYELERTDYSFIAARDVNNYVALTTKGKVKRKGIFTPAGMMKNPDREIVYEAVTTQLVQGVPVEETIRGCSDIRKFLTVRTVAGGGVWANEYLGKAIRFYHSTMVPKDMYIRYQKNENKVASSDGCRPMMQMFPSLPNDVDYDYYIKIAKDLLIEIGWH